MVTDATNESLHLGRIVTDSTPLISLVGDNLTLTNGAAFPDAGAVIVGGEIIKFTAKAGNVLSGLTRGGYATPQTAHNAGDTVYPAMWYVKINAGAMTAGYTKPGGA
jgi:hypothetical protein